MKLTIKIDDQDFVVEVGDLNSRPVHVLVDGEAFDVWPEEAAPGVAAPGVAALSAQPVTSAPPGVVAPPRPAFQPSAATTTAKPQTVASALKSVLAPIPGVIVSVAVKPGDTVTFGQELCVLEAMKMKNLIRANRAGTVAAVHVAAGDSVKHSQVLIDYSD